MARHVALGAFVALLAASAVGTSASPSETLAAPPAPSQPDVWRPGDDLLEQIAVAAGSDASLPVAAEVGDGAVVDAAPSPAPSPDVPREAPDPLTIMLDRLVELEGEWVRPIWDCIAWSESSHRQYLNGPTLDRGFVQITDFWWHGGFGRIGHPELLWVDPYDPMNQANGADAIWRNNGNRWRGQWAPITIARCGL